MATPPPDTLPPRSLVALWAGILGPPILWLAQFEVKYALAGRATGTHSGALMGTSLVTILLIAGLAYLAARERQISRDSPLDDAAGVVPRNHFMATLGLFSCGMFLLVSVAQFIADFFFIAGTSF